MATAEPSKGAYPLLKEVSNTYSQTLEAPATVEEIEKALPLAITKLQRIIKREGDGNGERLGEGYLLQLVAEQIREARATRAYKGKEPAARTTDSTP